MTATNPKSYSLTKGELILEVEVWYGIIKLL